MSKLDDIDRNYAMKVYGKKTVHKIEDKFREFHGSIMDPMEYYQVRKMRLNSHLVGLGQLAQVNYQTDKGEGMIEYYHRFKDPLPILAADVRGQLWIVGGEYQITPDGIED